VATRERRDSAQLAVRMTPAERDKIRRAIPKGELNSLVVSMLLRIADETEAGQDCLEDATTAA
jgi:hypothetical protein